MRFLRNQELVLQVPATSIKNYDALIEWEDSITTGLGSLGEVDGHDLGAGEMNIFVRTDNPELAFDRIKALIATKNFMPELKAAYRPVGKDDFTVIYPDTLDRFAIA